MAVVAASLVAVDLPEGLTPAARASSPGDTVSFAPGVVSTFAGSGDSAVVDGVGTQASFTYTSHLHVVGGFGYVFDSGWLRRIDLSTGAVTRVAGTGVNGYADSADPLSATVWGGEMAHDASYLYFDTPCDSYAYDKCIRRMSLQTGAISTLPGKRRGDSSYLALAIGPDAMLYGLHGSAVDRIDPATGALTEQAFTIPVVEDPSYRAHASSMAADASGLWVAARDEYRAPTSVLYSPSRMVHIDVRSDDMRTTSLPRAPFQHMVSAGDYLYGNVGSQVLRFGKSSGEVDPVAGDELNTGYLDGTGSQAWFGAIAGLGAHNGTLYAADNGSLRIRAITQGSPLPQRQPASVGNTLSVSPGLVSSFAGNANSTVVDGAGSAASFASPYALHVIGNDAYVTDSGWLRRIDLTSGAVTRIAGTGVRGFADSTNPLTAQIWGGPMADDGTYLYLDSACDSYGYYNCVRRMSLQTGAISTMPATRRARPGYGSLAVGPDGMLYGHDGYGSVDRIDPLHGTVTEKAFTIPLLSAANYRVVSAGFTADASGLWLSAEDEHHAPTSTLVAHPRMVHIKLPSGELETTAMSEPLLQRTISAGDYIFGTRGSKIVRFTKSSGEVAAVAGSDLSGYADGTGAEARFNLITGLATHDDTLFVTDSGNRRIRAVAQGSTEGAGDGPVGRGETDGGYNLSEGCAQQCQVGDPVNTATGEFWLERTDLALPGPGPELGVARSFATARRNVSGAFGFGWSLGFDASLTVPSGAGSTLATASTVEVLQENGSVVAFQRKSDGTYTAPDRVLATLVRQSDGTFTFTRRQTHVMRFNAAGALTCVEDLNGNALTVERDSSGHVVRVAASHGAFLQFSWQGGRITSATDQSGRSTSYTYSSDGQLTGARQPDGAQEKYAYDAWRRMVTFTAADGGAVKNSYDAVARVTTQTDPLGHAMHFAYGNGVTTVTQADGTTTVHRYDDGLLASVSRAVGTPLEATSSYTFGPSNHVQTVTDPLGRVTRYTHDKRGNVTSVTDPAGQIWRMAYDGINNVVSATNPVGETTSYVYDKAGNLTSSTDPMGAVTRFALNPDGTVARAVDATGAKTTYSYDAHGFVATTTDPTGAVTSTTYDSLGHLTALVSPQGNAHGADPAEYTSAIGYDPAGRPIVTTDALGGRARTSYDPSGRPTSWTDETGRVATATYDLAGHLLSRTEPGGGVTRWEYDGAGRVARVTDPDGAVTSYGYDVLGRPTTVTDALGRAVTKTYDAAGRVLRVTSPGGATTSYAYDAADRVTKVTDPLGRATTTTYDAAGRPKTVKDGLGRSVTAEYDATGRPTAITRADESRLAWAYDAVGRVTSYTDASGAKTAYTYDAAGRHTSTTDTGGRTTRFQYDPAGNLSATINPDGSTVRRSHDALDRLTGIAYSDATADERRSYDAASRLVAASAGKSQTKYEYNAAGRVTKVTTDDSAVGYRWSSAGLLSTLTYPGGRSVAYERDAAGQLVTVRDWAAREYRYDWTTDGQVAQITYPNGTTTASDYDDAGQLQASVAADGAAETLLALAYDYDKAGQLKSQRSERAEGPRGPPAAAASGYNWDPIGRLSAITGEGAGLYEFADAGQLALMPKGRTLTYDSAGQLSTLTVPATDEDPERVTRFGYDARGNRTSAATGAERKSYEYDLANRLTAVTGAPGSAVTYAYEASGLRASATTGNESERYAWDTLAAVPALLADGDHEYIYGVGGTPLAQIGTNGEVHYLHADAVGSVRALTDSSGAVVAESDYSAYGSPTSTTGAAVSALTKFGYAGEYTDATGLVYLRNRYYDPTTAQFLTRDPLEAVTANPYGYTAGNPLQYADPLGLAAGPAPGLGDDLWHAVQGVGDGFGDLILGLSPAAIVGTFQSLPDIYRRDGLGVAINRFNPVYGLLENASEGWKLAKHGCVRESSRAFIGATFATAGTVALAAGGASAIRSPRGTTHAHEVPIGPAERDAWMVLSRVDQKGSPLAGYKGGKTYQNTDGQLPRGATYQEWDLSPSMKGAQRDARRLVTGSDGSAFYTTDHYGSFIRVR